MPEPIRPPRYKVNLLDHKDWKPRIGSQVGYGLSTRLISVGKGINKKELYLRGMGTIGPNILNILKEAKEAGISVEIPVSYTYANFRKPGFHRKVFLSSGKPINLVIFKRLSRQKQQHIFNQIIDILAGLHNVGIVHSHPHVRNFVIDNNNRITIIDFKFAKKVDVSQIDWSNINQIANCFYYDYNYLLGTLYKLGLSDRYATFYLHELVKKYIRVSPNDREKLFKLIVQNWKPKP